MVRAFLSGMEDSKLKKNDVENDPHLFFYSTDLHTFPRSHAENVSEILRYFL